MDIVPSKVVKIIMHYDNCYSIEMRTDKIKCHGMERQKIINAAIAIEEEGRRQALDCFKTRP